MAQRTTRSLRETWLDQLGKLRGEVMSAFWHQKLWDEVAETFPDAIELEPKGLWVLHYSMLYLHAQAVAVRRMGRKSNQAIAPDGLIASIKKHRGEFESACFDGSAVDPEADLRRLKETIRPVVRFADVAVAHLDPTGSSPLDPHTWRKLDAALEVIADLVNAYGYALEGVTVTFSGPPDPVWQAAVACAQLLDDLKVPLDATGSVAVEALKNANLGRRRAGVLAGQRLRRERS